VLASPPAAATEAVVAVVGPAARSRLTGEIARELVSSGFAVVAAPAREDWRDQVLELPGPEPLLGVVVNEREGWVRLFRREAGELSVERELALGPDDRLFRRRTCLRVVEELRMMGQVPRSPTPPPAPALVLAAPRPLAARASAELVEAPPRPWALGVATTVNFDSGQAEPTSHVQWVWDLPLTDHLSVQARGLWPLVGSQLVRDDVRARLWSFAAGGGLAYALLPPGSRVRPFAGVVLGARLLLTESDWLYLRQSRVAFTPSAELAAEIGLRCRVAPFVDAFVELQAGRAFSLAGGRLPFEEDVANARLTQASLGMLFQR
jgi:hypothetical protein